MNTPPLLPSLFAAIIALSALPFGPAADHGSRELRAPDRLSAPALRILPALKLNKGDHISYIGNTLADRMQHEAWLETFIHHRFPKHELVFRNLGFPGDVIDRRPRSKDFGTTDQWLTKMETDVVFMFFGYNESFAGEAGLANFEKGFSKLLEGMKKQKYNGETAPQLVVFSPIAHEDLGNPDLPDGKENNARLALYTAAMRRVAATHHAGFVDLFELTRALYARERESLTMNGIHLNAHGNLLLGRAIDELLFGVRRGAPRGEIDRLRKAVLDKNFHWWSRYRTVDGYNVYGGRSKLNWNGQSNADVMQREMEVFDVMTANRDELIWAVAKGGDLQVDDSNTPESMVVKTNKPGPLQGAYPFLGGQEAIGKMKIAQGMEVNLFASEEQFPELINPVQMAVDTDSRLWVAVWPTYPHWNPKEELADKLVILPDENGDGKADRMITFADGLNSVTGFEFWGGGVLVAAAPEILFLKDTDGDDRADVKIRMLQGVSSADTHHTANALTFGPGGWLHWSRGVFHVTNMETPTGTFRSTTSGVYRFNPRTFEVEFHFPIGPNPHGDVFDQWGFQYATDGTSGTGNYVDIGKGQKAPKQLYVKRVRPVPATGILSSSHFPAKNDGSFLICNSIGFLGVLQHRFQYDGASISVVETEPILVSTDPNFRPTDLEVGGDGALYVSDWANPLIGHMQHNMRDPNRDHHHGRIYRVTASGRPLLSPPKMKGKPIGEVLAFLKSDENGTRYRARRELSGRNTKEVVAAAEVFAAGLDPSRSVDTQPLLEALWIHEEHRVVNVPLLKKAMASVDPKARAAAVRTLGHWGAKVKNGLSLLLAAARDEEPLVRAEAVKAVVNFDGLAAAEVVAEASTRATDIELDHVIDYARRQLSVDKILSKAVSEGRKLSVVLQSYMLRNASNADLLKMERTEAVDQAILSRVGIRAPARLAAASRLAVARSSTPLREVLKAARKLGEEGDGIAIDEISAAALELLASSEAAAKPQLEELAFGSEHAALRRLGFAGLLQLDPDAQALWDRASESAQSLRSLLEAVPGVKRKAVAEKIYARVRPLMLELPEALRGRAMVAETSGVEVDVFVPNPQNVDIKTLAKLKPRASHIVENFTLKIPGTPIERVALRFTSSLSIARQGKYQFTTSSDDGSRLYIDGKLVVNNDGAHGVKAKTGRIALEPGFHEIVVTYFDSGGSDSLVVSWKGPGIKKQAIPADVLGVATSDGLQAAAVRAVRSLPGHAAEKFADYAGLLRRGVARDAAVEAAMALPTETWPTGQVKVLAAEFTAIAAETPYRLRNTAQYQQMVELGRRLAAKLPRAAGKKLTDSLTKLDLQIVRIGTIREKMKYDKERFTVVSGKPVKIIFENEDMMPHNILISVPGTLEAIGALADKMMADPKGFDKHFIPDTNKVLWSTKLLQPGEKAELDFIAPKRGDYPYICTFPLHWKLMNGVMRVVDA